MGLTPVLEDDRGERETSGRGSVGARLRWRPVTWRWLRDASYSMGRNLRL